MQKPFTIAVVGKGRSRIFCVMSQPLRVNASASSASLKRTNSLTSAPAMKLSLPERRIRPFGFVAAISSSTSSSSSIASRENVFADSPCRSKVSQVRRCASCSWRQCL